LTDLACVVDSPTKSECLELFRALKNKDELSRSCKEIMQMLTAKDKGVMVSLASFWCLQEMEADIDSPFGTHKENEPLNTHGGSRTRGGISHAALQRRFTGKMSGVRLSG
jgi:hypothetical protein